MVGAGDDRPAPLRIGGWVPPTGRRAARLEDARATATALLPVLTPTDPDPPAQAAAPDESGRQSGRRRGAAGVRRWRVAALVAVATVAAAVGVPLLVSRGADQPGPDRQVQPAPQRPTRAPDAPVDPTPVAGVDHRRHPHPGDDRERDPVGESVGHRSAGGAAQHPRSTARAGPAGRTEPALAGACAAAPPPPSLFTTSLEAEGPAAERRGRADIRALAAASGGAVVTGIGDGSSNTVRFPQVVVPTAGRYTVTLYYVSTSATIRHDHGERPADGGVVRRHRFRRRAGRFGVGRAVAAGRREHDRARQQAEPGGRPGPDRGHWVGGMIASTTSVAAASCWA